MTTRFEPNTSFADDFVHSAEVIGFLSAVAETVASHATAIAHQVDPDYTAEVQVESGVVRVAGNAPGINPAAWIEFGNRNLAAVAPIRRGAQAAGLKLRATQ